MHCGANGGGGGGRMDGSSVAHIWRTTLIVNPEIGLRFTDSLPVKSFH